MENSQQTIEHQLVTLKNGDRVGLGAYLYHLRRILKLFNDHPAVLREFRNRVDDPKTTHIPWENNETVKLLRAEGFLSGKYPEGYRLHMDGASVVRATIHIDPPVGDKIGKMEIHFPVQKESPGYDEGAFLFIEYDLFDVLRGEGLAI